MSTQASRARQIEGVARRIRRGEGVATRAVAKALERIAAEAAAAIEAERRHVEAGHCRPVESAVVSKILHALERELEEVDHD